MSLYYENHPQIVQITGFVINMLHLWSQSHRKKVQGRPEKRVREYNRPIKTLRRGWWSDSSGRAPV
jgi:hypothetical protein